jgi:hypothetical protein
MCKLHGTVTSLACQFRPDPSRDELYFLVWVVFGGFLQVQNEFQYLLSLKWLEVL